MFKLLMLLPVFCFADLKVEDNESATGNQKRVYTVSKTKSLKKRDGTTVEVVDPDNTIEYTEESLLRRKVMLEAHLADVNAILTEIATIKAAR